MIFFFYNNINYNNNMSDKKRMKIESENGKKDTSEMDINTGMDEKNKKAFNFLMTKDDKIFLQQLPFWDENGRLITLNYQS